MPAAPHRPPLDNPPLSPYNVAVDDNITLEGMVTVAEAARRLGRSIEQIRRYLREGKLPGRRIGGQWFVDERTLRSSGGQRLLPEELIAEVDRLREEIRRKHGTFDVVALVRKSREEH